MADRVPMTANGLRLLKEELQNLKTVQRPANTRALEEARAHGDLSENADYSAAKERQSFIEGRIQEIEGKIATAEIIEPSKLSGERVVFGATVDLIELESEEERSYQIVGVDEADIKHAKISVTSPIARSLIGKTKGDEVVVRTPGGEKRYEIVDVRFL